MRDAPAIAERRSAPRHRLATLVTFPGGSGVTRDLSTTGLFFLTDGPFAVGQPVQLSITLEHADPESPTELTCRGRVCRVERQIPEPAGGTVVGVAVAADSFDFPGGPCECALAPRATERLRSDCETGEYRTKEAVMAKEFSRRQFIKISAGGMVGLYIGSHLGGFTQIAQAEPISGGTLAPGDIGKFVTPLLIPPVMPKAGTIKLKNGKNADYYEISMTQFEQQILPAGKPMTTVWGYGAIKSASKKGLLIHNAPSLTIEAKAGTPVRVKWINGLKFANGTFRPHLLPVDPTLHWANPPGGTAGRDTRPTFTSTPGAYNGPVPICTHVHGAVGVGDESDGYAEAWYLPAATNIPAGYATTGTWYDFFKAKAAANFGATWGPGFATFQYPNDNRASTIWYHDHALGMTRTNVYAGPAGFYIVRGGPAGDGAVLDSRFGTPAILPGPAPKEGDQFPFTQEVLRDPDRHPGSRVQLRRLAVLSR